MITRSLIGPPLSLVLPLTAVVHAVYSATGGERVMVVLTAIALGLATAFAGASLIDARRRAKRRFGFAAATTFGSLALLISTATTDWPLRVAYAYSRPQLEQLAQRVRDRGAIDRATSIGPFTIRRAELSSSGVVCLWTDYARHGNNVGFARWPDKDVPLNLWSQIDLSDEWHYVAED